MPSNARGLIAAVEIGMKEHDRRALARQAMERKWERTPDIVETAGTGRLVMAKPLVSAGMVARTHEVMPQAARRIALELCL